MATFPPITTDPCTARRTKKRRRTMTSATRAWASGSFPILCDRKLNRCDHLCSGRRRRRRKSSDMLSWESDDSRSSSYRMQEFPIELQQQQQQQQQQQRRDRTVSSIRTSQRRTIHSIAGRRRGRTKGILRYDRTISLCGSGESWLLVVGLVLLVGVHHVQTLTGVDASSGSYNSSGSNSASSSSSSSSTTSGTAISSEIQSHKHLVEEWSALIRHVLGLGLCIFALIGIYFHQFAATQFIKQYFDLSKTQTTTGRVVFCEECVMDEKGDGDNDDHGHHNGGSGVQQQQQQHHPYHENPQDIHSLQQPKLDNDFEFHESSNNPISQSRGLMSRSNSNTKPSTPPRTYQPSSSYTPPRLTPKNQPSLFDQLDVSALTINSGSRLESQSTSFDDIIINNNSSNNGHGSDLKYVDPELATSESFGSGTLSTPQDSAPSTPGSQTGNTATGSGRLVDDRKQKKAITIQEPLPSTMMMHKQRQRQKRPIRKRLLRKDNLTNSKRYRIFVLYDVPIHVSANQFGNLCSPAITQQITDSCGGPAVMNNIDVTTTSVNGGRNATPPTIVEYQQWYYSDHQHDINTYVNLILLKGKPSSACTRELLQDHLLHVNSSNKNCGTVTTFTLVLGVSIIVLAAFSVMEVLDIPTDNNQQMLGWCLLVGSVLVSTIMSYVVCKMLNDNFIDRVFLSAIPSPVQQTLSMFNNHRERIIGMPPQAAAGTPQKQQRLYHMFGVVHPKIEEEEQRIAPPSYVMNDSSEDQYGSHNRRNSSSTNPNDASSGSHHNFRQNSNGTMKSSSSSHTNSDNGSNSTQKYSNLQSNFQRPRLSSFTEQHSSSVTNTSQH